MKASLIIAVYNDLEALGLILDALKTQTYKNFEVIIAEDGNSSEMKEFISKVKDLEQSNKNLLTKDERSCILL